MKKIIGIHIVLACLLTSCGDTEQQAAPIEWNEKKSSKLHKELAIEQEIQIKLFLERHPEWKMEQTGSGLRYWIYEHGTGQQAAVGLYAAVETKVQLLDGTTCYTSSNDEYEEFQIDKSDIETGMQEAIKKMRIGDRAKLIIPSHLAHGLLGDRDKIPPLSTLVIDIHLIGLTQ